MTLHCKIVAQKDYQNLSNPLYYNSIFSHLIQWTNAHVFSITENDNINCLKSNILPLW